MAIGYVLDFKKVFFIGTPVAYSQKPKLINLERSPIMKKLTSMILAALSLSAVMTTASAGTVTFEDVVLSNGSYTNYSSGNGAFSSGGFNFNFQTSIAAYVTNAQICSPACPVNGTKLALAPYNTTLTMARADGGSFALQGFDGAGGFNFNQFGSPDYIPSKIHVSGFTADGTQFVNSFAIDKSVASGPLAFTSYTLDELFTNLVSVSFYSSGSTIGSIYNGFAIDNITVAEKAAVVPEPASVALFGLALAGYAASRRRRAVSPR